MGPLTLTLSLLRSVLVHETVDSTDGTMSIRNVCFSPDGKLLATAADDGVVRVSSRTFMLTIVTVVIIIFEPNAQHSTTFGALDLGYRQGANLRQVGGSHTGDLLARFLVRREIARLWVERWHDEDLGHDRRVVEDPWKRSCRGGKHGCQP